MDSACDPFLNSFSTYILLASASSTSVGVLIFSAVYAYFRSQRSKVGDGGVSITVNRCNQEEL